MLQLLDGLGFDLPHALARDLEDAADFFERVGVTIAQPVTKANDLALAIGQRLEQALDLVLENAVVRGANRILAALVLNELAEAAVFAVADRAVEADRVTTD